MVLLCFVSLLIVSYITSSTVTHSYLQSVATVTTVSATKKCSLGRFECKVKRCPDVPLVFHVSSDVCESDTRLILAYVVVGLFLAYLAYFLAYSFLIFWLFS